MGAGPLLRSAPAYLPMSGRPDPRDRVTLSSAPRLGNITGDGAVTDSTLLRGNPLETVTTQSPSMHVSR